MMISIKTIAFIIEILLTPILPRRAHAQEITTANAYAPVTIVVMPFTNGTARVQEPVVARRPGSMSRPVYSAAQPNVSQLSGGISEMLITQLASCPAFQILDRQALEAIQQEQKLNGGDSASTMPKIRGARFIITGTITELWSSNKNVGGLAGKMPILGTIGYNKKKTKVKLNARIIDSSTGVLVASIEADGESTKGSNVSLGGLAHGLLGLGGAKNDAAAEAVAQAAARSVQELSEKIIAKQGNLLTM